MKSHERLISAGKLVSKLAKKNYTGMIHYDDILATIADLPTVEAGDLTPEWISVKDRLPEESGMYIVTANDGHAQRVSFMLWQKRNKAWNLTGARSYWRVTHWQPMPQPPKGE